MLRSHTVINDSRRKGHLKAIFTTAALAAVRVFEPTTNGCVAKDNRLVRAVPRRCGLLFLLSIETITRAQRRAAIRTDAAPDHFVGVACLFGWRLACFQQAEYRSISK